MAACHNFEHESNSVKHRIVYPAVCFEQGSLTKWINAIKIQAHLQGCEDMIPSNNTGRPPMPPVDVGMKNEYLKRQRKLAAIIQLWTDPQRDWDEFDGLDPSSETIGTDMWKIILTIYNGAGAKAIQNLRKQFSAAQTEDETCLQYWQRMKKAMHGLKNVDRQPTPPT